MEQYIIKGGNPLVGEVTIGGAKNAALGILAAAIMSDEDVEQAFKLYQDYTDVIGYSKVVTLEDLERHGYTLAVNFYIEKPPAPPIDPAKVRKEYFEALDNVRECEDRLYNLLKEGGYLE